MTITIFLLMLSSGAFTPGVKALIGFECNSDSKIMKEISLVDVKPCQIEKKNITEVSVEVQLLQPKAFDTVNYVQCLIEINHLLYRCGKTIDTFHTGGLYTEVPEITQMECSEMINKKYYMYSGKKINLSKTDAITMTSTETHGFISGGSCTPGVDMLLNGV